MALTVFDVTDIIEIMENYLERVRPEESIRDQLDIGYNIDGQSIELFEIRPVWNDPSQIHHSPVAKTTFNKSKNKWKLYWMRANLKWHSYTPFPASKSLEKILEVIEQDSHGCFWG